MNSAALAQMQQDEFGDKFDMAKNVAGSFAAAFDKAMMEGLVKAMESAPGIDAVCYRPYENHGILDHGVEAVCYDCAGTDRNPIPWKEVMSNE